MPQRPRRVLIAWCLTVAVLVVGIAFSVYVLTGRSGIGTLIVAVALAVILLPVILWTRTAGSA